MRNNFRQRISWLSQRWRTQRNAIRNVNCRSQWIIKSLNAHCALWYSEEHACLRTLTSFTPPTFSLKVRWRGFGLFLGNSISRVVWNLFFGGHKLISKRDNMGNHFFRLHLTAPTIQNQ